MTSQDTPIYVEDIGQTLCAQDVEIRARVEGFLETVDFTEGSYVEAGALLYTIDARPFRAALAQAAAILAQAQTAADKARRDVERFEPLIEKNAISRQQFDDALAAEKAAAAQQLAASAQVEAARIQRDYARIQTPIAGIVGKTEVKPGNLVGRGQTTLLTTISTNDPIHLRFSISGKDYLAWQRVRAQRETTDKLPQNIFELILADGTLHKHRGRAAFADRQVDPTTGTLLLEVTFPNPERLVRPGQFGRVRFPAEIMKETILVPQRAVRELQATYSVFVATADNRAEFRKVELGPRVGSSYVITADLKSGERVVVEGVQKLQNGVPVIVKSVATPVEQQVNGVDSMVYMKSLNSSDGRMLLNVTFNVGTGLDTANTLTQNRVAQAQSRLPQEVIQQGVTVKKVNSSILMVVSLFSPAGTYDDLFLNNYAVLNVKDAILRVPGVSQVDLAGGAKYGMRICLQPDKLAKLGLTPTDVWARSGSRTCGPRPARWAQGLAARPGVHLHRACARPLLHAGGVRRHHHPCRGRRPPSPAQGRRERRARRRVQQVLWHAEWKTRGGFKFLLQDRSGTLSVSELGDQAAMFIAGARQRPEPTGLFTAFDPPVPQVALSVDREKAGKLGVPINDLLTTPQVSLGGAYVNDFNRFGRLYRVFVQAEADFRQRPEDIGQFYVCSTTTGAMIPLATLMDTEAAGGP